MAGFRSNFRVAFVVVFTLWVGLAALYGLLKPINNGCVMTYMYPTYVPIATHSDKYGLFLYHEGWKKIDFDEHLKKLDGVPVLFIPGNGGSYKQVRSLAAESDRAYQGGPLELSHYQEASLQPEEVGNWISENLDEFVPPSQYARMLDWFAVDLDGEHSAMDGRILEEHTEYVVYAIHRILEQYKESKDSRAKEGVEGSGSLPKSVILVGHSMGGFVARAAVVHPNLRKSAVETVITLSSPHRSPPVALQPSLGHFYSHINSQWIQGYKIQRSHSGRWVSNPMLSNVVVVSVSGGIHDYQVRSRLVSLNGIVPPTHGFTVSSTGMKNVWLSMEHQAILWCNQLVIQVSHALLSVIDQKTGQPFHSTQKRMAVLSKMLRSGVPQSFNWMNGVQPLAISADNASEKEPNHGIQKRPLSPCLGSFHWDKDVLEKDLYIQGTAVTVLAMDGKRRWLDIKRLGSDNGRHFMFVTNLAPCSGVRVHVWPEKGQLGSEKGPGNSRVVEVTGKMVQIPAGPAPRQIEPGSQTEQPPPSAVLWLSPEDMKGFRFLTISVAPQPTISGRPPPAASMAVGQFFNLEEGKKRFSWLPLLSSAYVQEEFFLKEDHPLALNLSFPFSLGLIPVTLSIKTAGCGIKSSTLPMEQAGDVEHSSLCKLRCFPPVALAWDDTSGLNIVPNLYYDTITMDSSTAFWDSSKDSEMTTVLLLIDPHCSYKIGVSISIFSMASRFLLLYCSQIIGFSISIVFYAMMRQARSWELDLPVPSMLTAVETNLTMPASFLLLAVAPLLISLVLSFLAVRPLPPFSSFIIVSLICYTLANGSVIALVLISRLIFHIAATLTVVIKLRWQVWGEKYFFVLLRQSEKIFCVFTSCKVVKFLERCPTLIVAIVAFVLVFLVHPAVGLTFLLLYHAFYCHTALCSLLAAFFRSHLQRKDFYNSRIKGDVTRLSGSFNGLDASNPLLPLDDNRSNRMNSGNSFGDMQLEIFDCRHGLLILHSFAALMFVPSLVAWSQIQRIGMGQKSFPWFLDSALCSGVILHGLLGWKPGFRDLSLLLPRVYGRRYGISIIYLLCGYHCYLSSLDSAPYKAFYAMALMGGISLILRIIEIRNEEKGGTHIRSRSKHSHKHY